MRSSLKKRIYSKLALCLALIFALTTVTGDGLLFAQGPASALSLEIPVLKGATLPFQIPPHLGTVKEYFLPRPWTGDSDERATLVIHIQDAHANPEAQRKISGLLERVAQYAEKTGADFLVATEGAQGPLHPEYLEFFAGEEAINQDLIESMLKKGELTGVELFAWERYQKEPTGKVRVIGVETPEIYLRNLQTYRELLFKEEEIEALLQPLRAELEILTSRTLSKELRDFLHERERRKEGNYGNGITHPQISAYLNFLAREVHSRLAIDLSNRFEQLRFPNLTRVLALAELEKKADPERAEREKDELIRLLEKFAPAYTALATALRHLETYQNPRSVLETLWKVLKHHHIPSGRYENFMRRAGSVILQSEVEADGLFEEIKTLEGWLLDSLIQSETERAVVNVVTKFDFLEKLLGLELTREEFQQLVADKDAYRPQSLEEKIEAIKTKLPRFSGTPLAKPGIEEIEKYFGEAITFYETASRRDKELVQNAVKGIPASDGRQKTIVALVSGGFHSRGVREAVKEQGLAYAEIQPAITSSDHGELYRKVLRNEHADLSAYFPFHALTKREALFLKEILETGIPALWKKHRGYGDIAALVSRAINTHPVLSEKMSARVLEGDDSAKVSLVLKRHGDIPGLSFVSQPREGEFQGAIRGDHAVSEALVTGYDYLRLPVEPEVERIRRSLAVAGRVGAVLSIRSAGVRLSIQPILTGAVGTVGAQRITQTTRSESRAVDIRFPRSVIDVLKGLGFEEIAEEDRDYKPLNKSFRERRIVTFALDSIFIKGIMKILHSLSREVFPKFNRNGMNAVSANLLAGYVGLEGTEQPEDLREFLKNNVLILQGMFLGRHQEDGRFILPHPWVDVEMLEIMEEWQGVHQDEKEREKYLRTLIKEIVNQFGRARPDNEQAKALRDAVRRKLLRVLLPEGVRVFHYTSDYGDIKNWKGDQEPRDAHELGAFIQAAKRAQAKSPDRTFVIFTFLKKGRLYTDKNLLDHNIHDRLLSYLNAQHEAGEINFLDLQDLNRPLIPPPREWTNVYVINLPNIPSRLFNRLLISSHLATAAGDMGLRYLVTLAGKQLGPLMLFFPHLYSQDDVFLNFENALSPKKEPLASETVRQTIELLKQYFNLQNPEVTSMPEHYQKFADTLAFLMLAPEEAKRYRNAMGKLTQTNRNVFNYIASIVKAVDQRPGVKLQHIKNDFDSFAPPDGLEIIPLSMEHHILVPVFKDIITGYGDAAFMMQLIRGAIKGGIKPKGNIFILLADDSIENMVKGLTRYETVAAGTPAAIEELVFVVITRNKETGEWEPHYFRKKRGQSIADILAQQGLRAEVREEKLPQRDVFQRAEVRGGWLVLTRKKNQKVRIRGSHEIEVTVVGIETKGGSPWVQLRIDAPPEVPIVRSELLAKNQPKKPLRKKPEGSGLILRRKINERIVIGDNITMMVVAIRGKTVRLGFMAPPDVFIFRDELPFPSPDAQQRPSEEPGAERSEARQLTPAQQAFLEAGKDEYLSSVQGITDREQGYRQALERMGGEEILLQILKDPLVRQDAEAQRQILRLAAFGKGETLQRFTVLTEAGKRNYLEGLKTYIAPHLVTVENLYQKYIVRKEPPFQLNVTPQTVEAPPTIPIARSLPEETPGRLSDEERHRLEGQADGAFMGGQVAIFQVAGGTGARLQFPYPKGLFESGPIVKEPLFGQFAQRIHAVEERYGQPVPWVIMTSEAGNNHAKTTKFFEDHLDENLRFFGRIDVENVIFAKQRELPTLQDNGEFIIRPQPSAGKDYAEGEFEVGGFGHGDANDYILRDHEVSEVTRYVRDNQAPGGFRRIDGPLNVYAFLKDRGIKFIQFIQVDNALALAPRLAFGIHMRDYKKRLEENGGRFPAETEHASPIVVSKYPSEKVGMVAIIEGKDSVLEYNQVPPQLTYLTYQYQLIDEEGKVHIWLLKRQGDQIVAISPVEWVRELNNYIGTLTEEEGTSEWNKEVQGYHANHLVELERQPDSVTHVLVQGKPVPRGRFVLWLRNGNLNAHIWTLETLNRKGDLPVVVDRGKEQDHIDAHGNPVKVKRNKFEIMVFNAPKAGQVMVTNRWEPVGGFAPIKNAQGADSPQQAEELISRSFQFALQQAGYLIHPTAVVQLDPTVTGYDDLDYLSQRVGKGSLAANTKLYLSGKNLKIGSLHLHKDAALIITSAEPYEARILIGENVRIEAGKEVHIQVQGNGRLVIEKGTEINRDLNLVVQPGREMILQKNGTILDRPFEIEEHLELDQEKIRNQLEYEDDARGVIELYQSLRSAYPELVPALKEILKKLRDLSLTDETAYPQPGTESNLYKAVVYVQDEIDKIENRARSEVRAETRSRLVFTRKRGEGIVLANGRIVVHIADFKEEEHRTRTGRTLSVRRVRLAFNAAPIIPIFREEVARKVPELWRKHPPVDLNTIPAVSDIDEIRGLAVTLQENETILINKDEIKITVKSISGTGDNKKVTLLIEAPRTIAVDRKEIYKRKQNEVGRSEARAEMPPPLARSEVRLVSAGVTGPVVTAGPLPTSSLPPRLLEILSTQQGAPLSLEASEVIRVIANRYTSQIYSLVSLVERYQSAGARPEEAVQFAVTFVVRELRGSLERPGVSELTAEERNALGEAFVQRFLLPPRDESISVKRKFVLAENLDELPPLDQSMKLWIRYLALHPNLIWSLDVDGVSESEARQFLEDLLQRASEWGLPLQSGQVMIHGSAIRGFDPEIIRQPLQGRSAGYLSEIEEYLRPVPLREGVAFRLTISDEEIRKTAERLLAAEALRSEVRDALRFHIATPEELATAQGLNYQAIVTALQAYTKLAIAA